MPQAGQLWGTRFFLLSPMLWGVRSRDPIRDHDRDALKKPTRFSFPPSKWLTANFLARLPAAHSDSSQVDVVARASDTSSVVWQEPTRGSAAPPSPSPPPNDLRARRRRATLPRLVTRSGRAIVDQLGEWEATLQLKLEEAISALEAVHESLRDSNENTYLQRLLLLCLSELTEQLDSSSSRSFPPIGFTGPTLPRILFGSPHGR